MLTDTQTDAVGQLMREVAAAHILPRFETLGEEEVIEKNGPYDLVTVADREAELAITPRLLDILPGSVVVGEEAVSEDGSLMDRLCGDDPVWLVDPVDGTINFVDGSDRFAVMVALVVKGETKAGWIYSPVKDQLAVTIRGEGVRLDGTPLPTTPMPDLAEARGDYSARFLPQPLRTQISERLAMVPDIRQGHCSAHAYLDTARGELDFVVQYLMTPWDHAAGTLMVEEVGGTSRFLDDETPYHAQPRSPRLMLTVRNEDGWALYRDALR